jgi:hypothetical protein
MHNRNRGTKSQIGFDFGLEQEQHEPDHNLCLLRHRFEQDCSLKTNDGS